LNRSVEKQKLGKWDNDEERGHSLSVIDRQPRDPLLLVDGAAGAGAAGTARARVTAHFGWMDESRRIEMVCFVVVRYEN